MASGKPNSREAKQARARLRAYQARQAVHERRIKRRRLDNIVAGASLLVLLVVVTLVQLAYFSTGPGSAAAPAASPSSSPSSSPTGTPSDNPSGSPSAKPGGETSGENSGDVPPKTLAEDRTWTGTLTLNNDVKLGIELDGKAAPQGVSSFISLAESGFYKGLSCHRMTDDGFYILQCGDPNGDGTGGPGYSYGPIENAPTDDVYPAGTIAMARQGGNAYSMGSQFFIVYDTTKINADAAGGYTVLGHITSGLDQLKTKITDKGVVPAGNQTAPKVPTSITGLTLK